MIIIFGFYGKIVFFIMLLAVHQHFSEIYFFEAIFDFYFSLLKNFVYFYRKVVFFAQLLS